MNELNTLETFKFSYTSFVTHVYLLVFSGWISFFILSPFPSFPFYFSSTLVSSPFLQSPFYPLRFRRTYKISFEISFELVGFLCGVPNHKLLLVVYNVQLSIIGSPTSRKSHFLSFCVAVHQRPSNPFRNYSLFKEHIDSLRVTSLGY